MNIEKDIRPVLASLAWSWLLAFIPTLVIWLRWQTVQTTVDGTSLTQKRGFLSKSYVNIDMSKVQNITGSESLFKGGSLTIYTTAGTEELQFIKDPSRVATELRRIAG